MMAAKTPLQREQHRYASNMRNLACMEKLAGHLLMQGLITRATYVQIGFDVIQGKVKARKHWKETQEKIMVLREIEKTLKERELAKTTLETL